MDERRRVTFTVDEQNAMDVFRVLVEGRGMVYAPDIASIPKGAKVLAVHTNYQAAGLTFVLEHESFEQVPSGCLLPELVPAEASVRILHVVPGAPLKEMGHEPT